MPRRKKTGSRLLKCCLCRNKEKDSPYAYEQAPLGDPSQEEPPSYRMYSFSDLDLLPAVQSSEVLYTNVVPADPIEPLPQPEPEPEPEPEVELHPEPAEVYEYEIADVESVVIELPTPPPTPPPKAPRLLYLPKEEVDDEVLISPGVLNLMEKYQTKQLQGECGRLYSQVQKWILQTGRRQRLIPPEAWVYTNILE